LLANHIEFERNAADGTFALGDEHRSVCTLIGVAHQILDHPLAKENGRGVIGERYAAEDLGPVAVV
jgi:hypothetical protein